MPANMDLKIFLKRSGTGQAMEDRKSVLSNFFLGQPVLS
jgi:hypothetical protein